MIRKFRQQTLVQFSFWIAAVIVGAVAVLYAQLINEIIHLYFNLYREHFLATSFATPFIFVAATFLVVKFAPQAKGSGIPQVLEAIHDTHTNDPNATINPLVSIKTAIIKIVSSLVGFIGGASIGREGPTVQISTSIFSWIGHRLKSKSHGIDLRSYMIAGSAAGVAAAFNTPLAGISFALEEIAGNNFSQFKRPVMFSIIIAGITAQAFVGDYLYFGHPTTSAGGFSIILESIAIGVVCGLLGGVFARVLSQKDFKFGFKKWYLNAFMCGVICSLIAVTSEGNSAGSGYETIKQFMDSDHGQIPTWFAVEKFMSTIFSYFSGMAGGIFSPTLSIGAGIGYSFANLLGFINLKICALIGMVAFFSGVVQAPLTAVIIVMEMTDEHSLIIPFMIAAALAQIIGRFIMPTPLYHYLAFGNKMSSQTDDHH